MINIERPTSIPASLQTQAIRDYLNDLSAWKTDQLLPKNQQTLSKPIPTPSYRTSDLIEAFDTHFFAKCYLTEKKFMSSFGMDVEHFLAKNFNAHPELRYEWTNLYPADHDANVTKPRIDPIGGYLDPCDPNDDVENDILYDLSFSSKKCFFAARNPLNQKAVNTAALLDRIHNGHNDELRAKSKDLRFLIAKQRHYLQKAIIAWQAAVIRRDERDSFRQSNRIKEFLSRKSAFTMLLRSVKEVEHLPREFFD